VQARRLPDDARVREVVAFYESLQPATVSRVHELYGVDAFFKDPFNEVRGPAAIARIFEHMFRQVDAPRFLVGSAALAGDTAFLEWTMSFRPRGRRGRRSHERAIRGCTALRFDAAGRIAWHRDYWDAAEELYEKVPLLGAVLRALRRRLAA
jgi:ketosteroid isomerase-like protein